MAAKKKVAPRKRSAKPKPPTEEPQTGPQVKAGDTALVVHAPLPQATLTTVPADGTLLRKDGEPVVYVMHGGQRRPFANVEAFTAVMEDPASHKRGWGDVFVLPPEEIDPIPQGPEVRGPADLQ